MNCRGAHLSSFEAGANDPALQSLVPISLSTHVAETKITWTRPDQGRTLQRLCEEYSRDVTRT